MKDHWKRKPDVAQNVKRTTENTPVIVALNESCLYGRLIQLHWKYKLQHGNMNRRGEEEKENLYKWDWLWSETRMTAGVLKQEPNT